MGKARRGGCGRERAGRRVSMFEISWTEFLLIGVVALIVIGPKELPGVLRTLGQYTRKVRGMAAEFQNQFQEAMREAEMADLKKQVDDMAQRLQGFRSAQGRARRRRDAWARTSRSSLGPPHRRRTGRASAGGGGRRSNASRKRCRARIARHQRRAGNCRCPMRSRAAPAAMAPPPEPVAEAAQAAAHRAHGALE